MESMSQAILRLKSEGFEEEFSLEQNTLCCHSDKMKIAAEDFDIEQVLRFDMDGNMENDSMVYVIVSELYEKRGLLIYMQGKFFNEEDPEKDPEKDPGKDS